MASRFMLIEFDDEQQATRLREQIDNASRAGKPYRVVGLFARPNAPYCSCGKEITNRSNLSTLKFGRKFGWFVCTECRRPANLMSALKNLMKPEDIIRPITHMYGAYDLMFYFYTIGAVTKAVPKDK